MSSVREREEARLAFVLKRDGLEEARKFARQTFNIYRAARKQRFKTSRCYGIEYREELVVSAWVLRRFLRTTERTSNAFNNVSKEGVHQEGN